MIEHVGSKLSAKIKIYILTRAKWLYTLYYVIIREFADIFCDQRLAMKPFWISSYAIRFLNALFYQDGQNGSQNGQEISQMFEEQQRTIENLEAQVTSKDRKIQQLEDQIKQLSMPLKPESF